MTHPTLGGYILGDTLSDCTATQVLKAVPLDGPAKIVLLHEVKGALSSVPEARGLLRDHADKWLKVQDLRALDLLDVDEADGTLFFVSEYMQGRVLADVLSRCRREGMPLATDQAVYLAERIAGALSSLATQNLVCKCLSPESVLISFEGEAVVFPCLFGDLQTTPVATLDERPAFFSFLPPDAAKGKVAPPTADVFALGAIFFECLTGEPFHPSMEAFEPSSRLQTVRDAVPEDLYAVLTKSLCQEEPGAYGSLSVMNADLGHLIASGDYSPTTFNMAFLMHSLYRGEDESETVADRAFSAVDRSPYQEARKAAEKAPEPPAAVLPGKVPQPPPEEESTRPGLHASSPDRKKLVWGLVAAGAIVVAVVVGLWLAFGTGGPSKATLEAKRQLAMELKNERAKALAQQEEMAKKLKALEEEKRALEDQVSKANTKEERRRAQRALADTSQRLNTQKKELEAKAGGNPSPGGTKADKAPVKSQPAVEKATPPQTSPPPPEKTVPPEAAPKAKTPPEETAKPKTKAGDFVPLWAVDAKPSQTRSIRIHVTSLARTNRLKGRIYVEVSIDERGKVTDAKVVKGLNPDYGMNEACRRAASELTYTPALKDGVPVKTKVTFPIMIK